MISVALYTRLLQVNEELLRFSFWPPWVGSGSVSLSAADVRNMWRHVCLRNPFPPFLFGIWSIHSPWEPQHAPPALDFCIIPKFCCSWRGKPASCRKGEGLVTELWPPKIATILWLCSPVTTANKAFSLRGLEAGLWAFRLQMFATCDDVFV